MNQLNDRNRKMKVELGLFIIVSFCCLIGSALIKNVLLDRLLVLLFIHTVMVILLVVSLLVEKIQHLNSFNNNRRFGRFIFIFLAAMIIVSLANWIPNFWEPILALTILMVLGSTPTIGMTAGLYLVMMQAI